TLKDYNRIYASSFKENIAEFIKPFVHAKTTNDDSKANNNNNIPKVKLINMTFEKYLVKWTLQCNENFDILKVESLLEENVSDELSFRPNYHNLPTPFTINAFCLDNDDLVIYGQLSLLIWTFSAEKKIKLIYCWHLNPNDDSIVKSLSSNSSNLE
ncbi:29759_t:CDS:1, partial [Gigaspora margarita]